MPPQWQLAFVKQNITWDWRGSLNYRQDADNRIGFIIDDRFTSNLLIHRFNQKKWRDENHLNAFIFTGMDYGTFGVYLESWALNDRQAGTNSLFNNHAAGLKSINYLTNNIFIKPYVGYQQAGNKSYIDWGWDLGMQADLSDFYLGDYRTSFNVASDMDLFPGRKNYAHQFDLRIHKQFSSVARDSMWVHYDISKQQYYSQIPGTLVNVDLESRYLRNILVYDLTRRSFFQLNTLFNSRRVADNTPDNANIRDVFRFENRFGYRFFATDFRFYLGFNTFRETLDNIDIRTDSEALQTGIQSDFSFIFSRNDQLDVQLNYIKFQYDTPSLEENDDRDEVRFIGLIRYAHRFSDLLDLQLDAYGNLYHRMYIYKAQSANNSWNRIYKLQSTVNYNNGDWRNALRTQVLANYTVYDFDHLFKDTRSYIFRKYAVSDSLIFPILYQLQGGAYVRLELEDRGTYYKEDFSQFVSESSQILFYDVFLKKRGVLRLDMEVGFAVYHRRNWRHVPVSVTSRDIRRVSPYIRLVYPLGRNLKFLSQISRNFVDDKGREKSEYMFGRMDLQYYF